jgi:hypothetical protein
MTAITPEVLEYYETFLRIAEAEGNKVQVKPDEMRAFIEAAKVRADPDRVIRVFNEEEARLARLAGGPDGVNVADIRSAFARLRQVAALHGGARCHPPTPPPLRTEMAGADDTGHWLA